MMESRWLVGMNEMDLDSILFWQQEEEALQFRISYIMAITLRVLVKIYAITIPTNLEPPHYQMWDILKPILSHDAYEIEHPYVYDAGNGLKVYKVVTRGWPACIFCSAKNESDWPVWPEIQSRFLITSPNMVQKKYAEGNKLIAQRMGLPNSLQQDLIISDTKIELAKKCVRYIRAQIRRNNSKSPVWIPYTNILGELLPALRGTDNRITKRLYSFLVIITLARSHLRWRLEYGDESLSIADIENDLQEVLRITQNISGVPPFKLRVFKEVFLPLYRSKLKEESNKPKQDGKQQLEESKEDGKQQRLDSKVDGDKDDKQIVLTTRELSDYYKKAMNKTITTDSMKKTYLNEFLENGLIDECRLDGRQNVYFPIIDLGGDGEAEKMSNSSNMSRFDIFSQDQKIFVPNNCKKIEENWLELEISTFLKYRICGGVQRKFGLYNKHGERVCVCKFIKDYNTPTMIRYFSKAIFSNSYKKTPGDIKCLSTTIGNY
jgi:hypothetical protein